MARKLEADRIEREKAIAKRADELRRPKTDEEKRELQEQQRREREERERERNEEERRQRVGLSSMGAAR